MKLKELLRTVPILETNVDLDMEITMVSSDTRKEFGTATLFIALSGFAFDGNRFIPKALEKGAVAVVTAKKPEGEVPFILVEDDRIALARISCNYYGHPTRSMVMIGVTGTNGKTSTTLILKHILEKTLGAKVGLIGTVENRIGQEVLPTDRTTPESIQLQELFAKIRDAGCSHAIMEVSSHAIALHRVEGIQFTVGAFTNLTPDHLDFHKTLENYGETKAQLFAHCDKAVVNADSPWGKRMAENCAGNSLSYGQEKKADLMAKNAVLKANGVTFTAVCGEESAQVEVPIPGTFTVYNVLTTMGIAHQLGIHLAESAKALRDVAGVKGRVEVVPTPGKDYTILIDYAHTPDGLENVLSSVRGFCKGRLIAVFGCGGDRDRTKRPVMGGIGVRMADVAVITSDNPRTEAPGAIIADILEGVGTAQNYVVEENRVKAIHYAMDIAQKDDIIVLAGKGHETYQEICGVKHHMDEREIVADYL